MGKQGRRICIVDDDLQMCRSLDRLLASYGIVSNAYTSGESFLASNHWKDIFCLLLDIDMPNLNGFQVHERLKERGYQFPIILMTGRFEAEFQKQAAEIRAMAILQKPFDSQTLMDLIDTF